MPSSTTIRICDPYGTFLVETAEFLDIGNNPGLRYVLSCGQVGAMTVTLPPAYNPLLLKDGRIHIMRSVNGGPAAREGGSCFLIRRWDYADDYTTITAVHANDLMRRRFVLDQGSIGNNSVIINEPADDAIKTKWMQSNGPTLGTISGDGISTFRAFSTVTSAVDQTQNDISSYVSVQAKIGAAPVMYKYQTWRNLLDVFLDIEQFSAESGTYLVTEIAAPTDSTLELRTFTGQRGTDRRFSTGNGLLFTSARGNIENAILTVDALEEITFAQALGASPFNGRRYAGTAKNAARMAGSPFGRIETISDSNDAPNDRTLTDDSAAAVRGGIPITRAVTDIVETDQCVRGVHFDYGDYITVELQGIQYDMRLNLLEITLTGQVERTVARFEYNGS